MTIHVGVIELDRDAVTGIAKDMKYFVYCRKSTESEDRQILSIDSQHDELMRAFSGRPEIEIVEVFKEAYSAKAPGRAIFDQMLARLERGEADGIVAWHPDRLARNSVDGGRVIYLLDRKVLKDLKFSTFSFENNSQGKFMLSIIFGYSKYYVDSLSDNVKRGNRAKVERGWRPNTAPLGYRNDKETKTIIRDPIHFPLIRRMYDLMLTRRFSPKDIALIARDDWAFRTPIRKRTGGNPLAMSTVYRILTNPFYAGVIEWGGQKYPGKHEQILSLDEFLKVQQLLGRTDRPRRQRHMFAFTGLIRCGDCGLMVTAEHKVNRFGSRYLYYHCSKRRLGPRCLQPSVDIRSLESQIIDFLSNISVSARVHPSALDAAMRAELGHPSEGEAARQSVNRTLSDLWNQLSELTVLRVRAQISDDEFVRLRGTLQQEVLRLQQLQKIDDQPRVWFEPLKEIVSFSNQAVSWFSRGDTETKRLILETTGSNPMLKNKILNIEARKPFRRWPRSRTNTRLLAVVNEVRTQIQESNDLPLILKNIKTIKERIERSDSMKAA